MSLPTTGRPLSGTMVHAATKPFQAGVVAATGHWIATASQGAMIMFVIGHAAPSKWVWPLSGTRSQSVV